MFTYCLPRCQRFVDICISWRLTVCIFPLSFQSNEFPSSSMIIIITLGLLRSPDSQVLCCCSNINTQAVSLTSGRGRLRFEDASLHQSAADEAIHQLLELFLPWLVARLLTGTCSWVTGGKKWTYYTAASAQIYIRVSRALFHPWLCISVTSDYLIHVFLHPPSLYLSQTFLPFISPSLLHCTECVWGVTGWLGGWVFPTQL